MKRSTLRDAINNYCDAIEDNNWKGHGHPDDYEITEQRMRHATKVLLKAINNNDTLTGPPVSLPGVDA